MTATDLRAILQPTGVADEGGVGHALPEILCPHDAVGDGRPREDIGRAGVGGAGHKDEPRRLGDVGVLHDHLAQGTEPLLKHLGLPVQEIWES